VATRLGASEVSVHERLHEHLESTGGMVGNGMVATAGNIVGRHESFMLHHAKVPSVASNPAKFC
jgi:hypothetical protein